LDAVHAIYDRGALHVLREIADAVHEQGREAGRKTLVIAESDLNDPRVVRDSPREGYGCDAQWSDDFHHAIHAALTGERAGYYHDFGSVEDIGVALRDRFVRAGGYSEYRDRRHGAPAGDLPADRFVVFLQNHDQIGNRAAGERLDSMLSPGPRKLAAAALLLSPFVPLLFMGEEYGETSPFLYFVSHENEELARAVREGRAREFRSFGWTGELPDPQAESSFERSTLNRGGATEPRNEWLRALYRDLLRIRASEPALKAGKARVEVEWNAEQGWVRLLLVPFGTVSLTSALGSRRSRGGANPLLVILNFAGELRNVPVPDEQWRGMFSTEAQEYGGNGAYLRTWRDAGSLMVVVPAHAAELYVRGES
jgi:maltooligosyltrehalose trehalohydrolase